MSVHGKSGRFLFGGHDFSRFLSSVSSGVTFDNPTVTTFTKNSVMRMAGLTDGKADLTGVSAFSADELDKVISDVLTASKAADAPLYASLCRAGYGTIGAPVELISAIAAAHEITSDVNDAVRTSISLEANEDAVEGGVILADLAARTANGNASSVDHGAASANGLVAHLHCTAFSGLTSITVKVQHSTDNSAWSDLITFVATSAAETVQRLSVTGTVNRYLRELHTVVGTGSATIAVTAARR